MAYPVNTTTLKLEYPIEIEGKKIEELNIRRPLVRDQLIADKQNKDSADKEMHLMSLLAGVDREIVELLDLYDYGEVQKVIMGFRKKPSQSEKSSEE
ncbi:phage tail assembly protein [Vibrio fluvialis]|nr:phage tail assembly protein [Vibrio fluvialis]ELI5739690.1 phage tail assembly protein [Vibrio fluvialis]